MCSPPESRLLFYAIHCATKKLAADKLLFDLNATLKLFD